MDHNFSGPGGEKRSVRELAAGLIKHGGPESDGKRKIGSHSESGWKISTFSHAIYGYLCIANVCFHVDAMLLRCTVTLLLYKHTQINSTAENRQVWYIGGNKLSAAYSNIGHLHSAHEC